MVSVDPVTGRDGKEVNEYEDLARCAQRLIAERPVVVLGTGATMPYGLPSMDTLAAHLMATIKSDPPGWQSFVDCLAKTNNLEIALHEVTLPQETVESIVSATWELVSAKDISLYERLLSGLDKFPLADIFKHLLRTADPKLHVVTTNYDRVAEYAANYVGAYVSSGVTAGWLQRFVPAAVDEERAPKPGYEGQVNLLKVHGSLDWFRDQTENIIGIPQARLIPATLKPLIVTPGVSKYREVHKDPFRTVMASADKVLRSATCYLCIGYGFNDEHVQPILVQRVTKNDIPLVVVTKELSPMAKTAFLAKPPKKFLFLEECAGGAKVYNDKHPDGVCVCGVSAWTLDGFMKLITGEKVG